ASLAVERANDMAEWIRDRYAIYTGVVGVLTLAFVFLHLELNRTFQILFPPLRLPILSLLWLAMCGLLLFEYLARRSLVLLGILGVFAGAVLLKLFFFDLPSWEVQGE